MTKEAHEADRKLKPLEDWESYCDDLSPYGMLSRIRRTLQARLEGRNEGGDIEVMRLVDEIVKREGPELPFGSTRPDDCSPMCEGCEICRPRED